MVFCYGGQSRQIQYWAEYWFHKDVHSLIPESDEPVRSYGKGEVADVTDVAN